MTRILQRETFFDGFPSTNLFQITGESICFCAALKESHGAISSRLGGRNNSPRPLFLPAK